MFHQRRCSGVYHMIWQPFSQAGSSTGYNFLVICDWVEKRLISGVSNAGIAPCGIQLFAVQGTWDVALAIQADIPQGMWMLLCSPALKTPFCNTFRCAPRSLSHTPSILAALPAPEAAGLGQSSGLLRGTETAARERGSTGPPPAPPSPPATHGPSRISFVNAPGDWPGVVGRAAWAAPLRLPAPGHRHVSPRRAPAPTGSRRRQRRVGAAARLPARPPRTGRLRPSRQLCRARAGLLCAGLRVFFFPSSCPETFSCVSSSPAALIYERGLLSGGPPAPARRRGALPPRSAAARTRLCPPPDKSCNFRKTLDAPDGRLHKARQPPRTPGRCSARRGGPSCLLPSHLFISCSQ